MTEDRVHTIETKYGSFKDGDRVSFEMENQVIWSGPNTGILRHLDNAQNSDDEWVIETYIGATLRRSTLLRCGFYINTIGHDIHYSSEGE